MIVATFVLPGTSTPAVTDYAGLESCDGTPVRVSVYDCFGDLITTFDVPGNSYNYVEVEGIGSITTLGYANGSDDWYVIDTFTFTLPVSCGTLVECTI